MNKRYYEHTLPIIRGSLSNTYVQGIILDVRMFRDDKMLSKNYDLFVRDEQCDIYE